MNIPTHWPPQTLWCPFPFSAQAPCLSLHLFPSLYSPIILSPHSRPISNVLWSWWFPVNHPTAKWARCGYHCRERNKWHTASSSVCHVEWWCSDWFGREQWWLEAIECSAARFEIECDRRFRVGSLSNRVVGGTRRDEMIGSEIDWCRTRCSWSGGVAAMLGGISKEKMNLF